MSTDSVPGRSRALAPDERYHPGNITEMLITLIKIPIVVLLLVVLLLLLLLLLPLCYDKAV